jgi:cytochrome P450
VACCGAQAVYPFEDELISLAFLILWAGYELTVDLIGNLILKLLRHPHQMDLLRSRPDLAPSAVDEAIRYTAPGPFAIRRFATEEAIIEGVRIPVGDTILLCLASAHRDPAHFPEPERFDIQRTNSSPLLGFGHGIHYCLGAPLARLEAAIAVNVLLGQHPRLTLAIPPADLRWRPSFRSRGLLALPVDTRR